MTHTLTITDHPDDEKPIVSLNNGKNFSFALLAPANTSDEEDRAALVDAVTNLLGPRSDLPADLRDDARIAWVPDAGDGEGAWCVPLDVRQRLISEGWIFRYEDARPLFRPPAEPATERVRLDQVIGRRLPTGEDQPITVVHIYSTGAVWCGGEPVTIHDDGTVTVLVEDDDQ